MKTQIKIENLKCNGCASTIRNGLLKFKEISTVNIDIENSIVEIVYDSNEGDVEKYIAKLKALGYPQVDDNSLISKAKSYVSCAIGRVAY